MGRRRKFPTRRGIGDGIVEHQHGNGERERKADLGNADRGGGYQTAAAPTPAFPSSGSIEGLDEWGSQRPSSYSFNLTASQPGHEEVIHYDNCSFDLGLIEMGSTATSTTPPLTQSKGRSLIFHSKPTPKPVAAEAESDRDSPRSRKKCPDCARTFSSASTLWRHQKTHSENPKQYGCDVCGKRFTQRFNMTLHKRKAHPEQYEKEQQAPQQRFKGQNWAAVTAACRVKPKSSERGSEPPEPEQYSSGLFKCHACPKTFAGYAVVRRHQHQHHPTDRAGSDKQPAFQCNVCGKGLKTEAVMVCHLQRFHQEEYWAQLQRINPDVRVLQCPKCPAKFTMNRVFQQHLISMHRDAQSVQCCGRLGPRARKRRRVEASQRALSCQFCPITLRKSYLYREHMELHAKLVQSQAQGQNANTEPGETPACPTPTYRITPKLQDIFARIGPVHLRVKYLRRFDPTINLPQCAECGRYSTSKESLVLHQRRLHDAEVNTKVAKTKPPDGDSSRSLFQCLYCPRLSVSALTLRRHVLEVHEDARQYESKYCCKVFKYRHSARDHEQLHERRGICYENRNLGINLLNATAQTRSRPRICELCGEVCQTEFLFVQHFLKRHGGGDGGKAEVRRLKIKPVNINETESLGTGTRDCILCTVCGNWFKKTEFKIHLALTQATCGSAQDYQTEFAEVPEPENDFQMESHALDFGSDVGVQGREPDTTEAETVRQPSPSSLLPLLIEIKEEVQLEPEFQEPEVEAIMDVDVDIGEDESHGHEDLEGTAAQCADAPPMLQRSDITRHILDQHLQCSPSVSLSRMLFKYNEQARTMSVLRPSADSLNIPWYVCSKCGRAFAFRVDWQVHRLSCPKQYDFRHANMRQVELLPKRAEASAEIAATALLQEQITTPRAAARKYAGGWTDRWDTNLLPEVLPHPSTRPGIVMLGGAAYCRVCLKHFGWCWGIEGHLEQHEYEAAVAVDPTALDPSSRWKQLEDGRIQCVMCEKTFGPRKREIAMAKWKHYRAHHPPATEKAMAAGIGGGGYPCEYCGKRLGTRSTLRDHVRARHTGEKPIACDLCPARFPSTIHLAQHKRNKHDSTPVQCAECGRMCKNKADHYLHVRGHKDRAGEPTETRCVVCDKEFTHWRRLRAHAIKVHGAEPVHASASSAEPPKHVCDKCGKNFTMVQSLRRHLITEHPADGVKPKFFQCKLCDRGVSLVSSMRSHLRSAHADQLWPTELLQQNQVTVIVPMPAADGGGGSTETTTTYSLEDYFTRNKWRNFK